MGAEWYYESDGQQHGPLSAVQLRQLAAGGKLQAHHLLWKEGMQKKVPARSVKGLFSAGPAPGAGGALQKPAASGAPMAGGGVAVASSIQEVALEAELVEEVEEAFEVVEEAFEVVEEVEEAEASEEAEEVEEVEEEPRERAAKKTPERDDSRLAKPIRKEPEVEILAEASVTYRKGLPGCKGPQVATLYVETDGLRFEFEDEDEELSVPFERVLDASAPTEGDHPPGSWSKAMSKKMAGKMGKIASGMLGNAIGGIFGNAAKKTGEEVSGMVEKSSEMGPAPINRIVLLVQRRQKRCRVYFDVNGDDRKEMNQEAQFLFQTLQKARKDFAAPKSEEAKEVEESGFEEVEDAPEEKAEKKAAGGTSGERYRVQRGGKVIGTYSLDELRRLLGSKRLNPTDLIGIEAWIPVASLGGLLLATSPPSPPPKARTADEPHEEPKAKKAKEDDDGAIPVDDEFKL
jgi:hypothetical protein